MTAEDVMTAARIAVVRAAVTAGEVETIYWRAGQGETVILLGADYDDDEHFAAEIVRLTTSMRVIVPELVSLRALCLLPHRTPHVGCTTFAEWLCNFVEGLGLTGAHLVGTQEFTTALQSVARDVGDRFGSIVCLDHDPSDISGQSRPQETGALSVTYLPPSSTWPETVVQRLQASSTLPH